MEQERGRIVVGVDGSPGSRSALAFAVRDAARRGAAVEVVAAVARPDYLMPPYRVPPTSPDEVRDQVHRYVKHTVQEVIGTIRGELTDVPPVTLRTVAGSPAEVMLETAEGADLLVVGSRGHGRFSSALLGSVSLHCTLHSTCPITVVHGAERETASEARGATAATAVASPAPA